MTAGGVLTADGVEREVDCVIYGTGFRTTHFMLPMEVTGAGGVPLRTAWGKGAHAHLGITVPGFPSLFLMYRPNTNTSGGSIIVYEEAQAADIGQALEHVRDRGAGAIAVRPMSRLPATVSCRHAFRRPPGPSATPGIATRPVGSWPTGPATCVSTSSASRSSIPPSTSSCRCPSALPRRPDRPPAGAAQSSRSASIASMSARSRCEPRCRLSSIRLRWLSTGTCSSSISRGAGPADPRAARSSSPRGRRRLSGVA